MKPGQIISKSALLLIGILLFGGCAGGSLTTREKGAGIGALGGAADGGIVRSAVGNPGAGAVSGAAGQRQERGRQRSMESRGTRAARSPCRSRSDMISAARPAQEVAPFPPK